MNDCKGELKEILQVAFTSNKPLFCVTKLQPIRAYLIFNAQLNGARIWSNEILWWAELTSV